MRKFEWFRTPVRKRSLPALLVPVVAGVVAACGAGERASPGAEESADATAETTAVETAEATVFFTVPQDGAAVTSPFMVRFGAQNIEIGAVPQEVVTPREGVVHHHLGLNTDCLPPGSEIPQAAPWIHFGDGSNEIEMNLEPGEHRLAVQAGDDEHRTIEGLCQIITVTVRDDDS